MVSSRSFIIKKTIRYAYGPKKLSEMVRKKTSLENRTGNKLTIEKLIDTLRGYNFQHFEGSGYIPTYTRNDATDILHEAFGFRTDYQINGEKNMKKIIKNTKTGKY